MDPHPRLREDAWTRAYGLTTGGKNASEFGLTDVGRLAASDDSAERRERLRKSVMNVEPFRQFLTAYDRKKVPLPAAFKAYLTGQAGVYPDHADQCMTQLLADADLAGFIRTVKGSKYVDLAGTQAPAPEPVEPQADDDAETLDEIQDEDGEQAIDDQPPPPAPPARPAAIFIGHGKNKKPRDQLTKILAEYELPFEVAIDEPNSGRPISQKVAEVMDKCGAVILIFTADDEFKNADGDTTWRPSENVVYELGAASAKYGSRIIIFKEEGVDFPTNFRDIGHISFENDHLDSKGMELLRELIAFKLIKFSVPIA